MTFLYKPNVWEVSLQKPISSTAVSKKKNHRRHSCVHKKIHGSALVPVEGVRSGSRQTLGALCCQLSTPLELWAPKSTDQTHSGVRGTTCFSKEKSLVREGKTGGHWLSLVFCSLSTGAKCLSNLALQTLSRTTDKINPLRPKS